LRSPARLAGLSVCHAGLIGRAGLIVVWAKQRFTHRQAPLR
jgi:hypothetical protein